jgi:hypothetical protein
MASPSAVFVPELDDVDDAPDELELVPEALVPEDPELPEAPDELDDPVAVVLAATGGAAWCA